MVITLMASTTFFESMKPIFEEIELQMATLILKEFVFLIFKVF